LTFEDLFAVLMAKLTARAFGGFIRATVISTQVKRNIQVAFLIAEIILSYRAGRRMSRHREETADLYHFMDVTKMDPLLPDSKKFH